MKRRALAVKANPRFLPQSSLGKAVKYFLNEYTAVVGCLRDGQFLIDNNLVENDVRPSVVGRNYADNAVRESEAQNGLRMLGFWGGEFRLNHSVSKKRSSESSKRSLCPLVLGDCRAASAHLFIARLASTYP